MSNDLKMAKNLIFSLLRLLDGVAQIRPEDAVKSIEIFTVTVRAKTIRKHILEMVNSNISRDFFVDELNRRKEMGLPTDEVEWVIDSIESKSNDDDDEE